MAVSAAARVTMKDDLQMSFVVTIVSMLCCDKYYESWGCFVAVAVRMTTTCEVVEDLL